MKRLVILAYGRETEYQRAIFAVLSFWAWYDGSKTDVHTLVFTDQPSAFAPYFEGLPVDYELLTPERLLDWRGPNQYVHRVKLACLAHTLQLHPNDDLLFCDSDTFFVAESDQLLQRLRPGTSLMHQREYRLEDAVGIYAAFHQARYPRKLLSLIDERTFRVGSQKVRFRKAQYSWNSGVLGLGAALAPAMPDILALNDEIYAHTGWFTSEQIAFSLALPVLSRVIPAEQFVLHYWGQRQKQLMDSLLREQLKAPFGRLPLPERLAQVRPLTLKWLRKVEINKDREGALYALGQGDLVAGLKCAIKALIAAPFSASFLRDLWQILTQRSRGRMSHRLFL